MLSLAAISAALSPHPKISFLADKAQRLTSDFCRTGARPRRRWQRRLFFGRALLLRIQPKHLELPTPFRRSIAQPRDVDASMQAALDRSADQLGSKKGERDGHVDMTDAASLAQCDLVDAWDGSRGDVVQPAPAASDGADQSEASFRPLWPDVISRQAMRQEDLPESLERRLLPGNRQNTIACRRDIPCWFGRPCRFPGPQPDRQPIIVNVDAIDQFGDYAVTLGRHPALASEILVEGFDDNVLDVSSDSGLLGLFWVVVSGSKKAVPQSRVQE
jgi:hypothetical protein